MWFSQADVLSRATVPTLGSMFCTYRFDWTRLGRFRVLTAQGAKDQGLAFFGVGGIKGCEARITACIKRPLCSFRGCPSEWADRDRIRGAGGRVSVGSKSSVTVWPAKAPGGPNTCSFPGLPHHVSAPVDNAIRQPDGFGQA